MKQSLLELKERLIERWVKAHAEIKDIPNYEARVVSSKYATGYRYEIKNFSKGRFRAGGKMLNEKPLDGYDCYEYGFDEKGLPVIEKFSHTFNKIDWVGIYKIEEDLIEQVEFCTTTSVVSELQRVSFDKSKKLSIEHFSINGKTASLIDINQPIKKIIDIVNTNSNFFVYHVQEFAYADNRIIKACGLVNSPGIGEYFYEDIYTYDALNILEKIVRHFDNGVQTIEYSKPSIPGLKNLTTALATSLCDYLIGLLQAQNFDSPLFNVQLNYQYCGSYMPSLLIIKEQQKKDRANENPGELFFDGDFLYAIENRPPKLEELYAEFERLMQKTDNWEAGRKMLKQTALLMTKSKLKGLVPVTEDFIVFSIEWIMEVQELEKILLQCGASKANIKAWKKQGFV